jgi:hypothetical protein
LTVCSQFGDRVDSANALVSRVYDFQTSPLKYTKVYWRGPAVTGGPAPTPCRSFFPRPSTTTSSVSRHLDTIPFVSDHNLRPRPLLRDHGEVPAKGHLSAERGHARQMSGWVFVRTNVRRHFHCGQVSEPRRSTTNVPSDHHQHPTHPTDKASSARSAEVNSAELTLSTETSPALQATRTVFRRPTPRGGCLFVCDPHRASTRVLARSRHGCKAVLRGCERGRAREMSEQ